MKILLIVKSMAIECLGPQYLSAIAKETGHQCRIVALDNALAVASTYKPDLVGYSVLTGDQKRFVALNDALKQRRNFVSVFGGSHATFFPQDFAGNPNLNCVVQGEAENEWAKLLGSEKRYPDINSIPWPERSDFPNRPIRDFLASRGCASSCSYCFNSTFNKMFPDLAKVRTRDVDDVVNELASIQDAEFFYAQDSCFGVSMKWMRAFSYLYHKKINLPYHVHLRPKMVNEERVLLLHDSHCVSVKIALETASSRLRKLINRGPQENEDAYIAARLLRKWDIALIMQNILGLPTATIEDDLETLEVNMKCRPAYAWVSIFQPYPKTELANYCEKEGIYTGDYSEIGDNFFDKSVLNLTDEHKEQVACLQRIFAFAVEHQTMPEISDLSWDALPKFISKTMRKIGDKRMFPGVL